MIDLDEAERIGRAAYGESWHNSEPCLPNVLPRSEQVWSDSLYLGAFNTPWKSYEQNTANAAFVCYARNHWQEMVDEIRRLRDENQQLKSRVDDFIAREWPGFKPPAKSPTLTQQDYDYFMDPDGDCE